jgi:hypothetical protein
MYRIAAELIPYGTYRLKVPYFAIKAIKINVSLIVLFVRGRFEPTVKKQLFGSVADP